MAHNTIWRRCCPKVIRSILMAVVLAGPVPAEPLNTEPQKEVSMARILVIVGKETLTATLDDTPAGRDFATLLPLQLSLRDYNATEKIADLPRTLDITDMPASYTPKAGDITYYAPWGNLAIFYRPFQTAKGLVRLGAFDGAIDALVKDGAIAVRIQAAE